MDSNDKTKSGCPWRPKSSRVGIKPSRYFAWNFFYFIMESLNRKLSFNPNRKISWDKWPVFFGVLYLMAKVRFNRSNALTDPYDYKANDNVEVGAEPEVVHHGYISDGFLVSDKDNPQMGKSHTRFSSNIPPLKVRPDVEKMSPSAHDVGKHRWRKINPETGKEIVIPALILNDLASGWIQFEFHAFGGDTLRDPATMCPYTVTRSKEDGWPDDKGFITRATKDPTRESDNERPTIINKRSVAWIQGQIYGNTDEQESQLRVHKDGKFIVDADGRLPEDPKNPGIDKTGFNHDFNPLLSLLHWLFVSEHNAIADYYASFHPDWDDEKLFQMSRKVNVALAAHIHTLEWTKDLLQHPTLQTGMNIEWYGPLGQKGKLYLMRFFDRHPTISRLMTGFRNWDVLWGMPGSKWEHHDGPFQLSKHFRLAYRLHELILSEHEICETGSDRTLDRIELLDFIHSNTRSIVAKFGYETLAWSFVKKSCGALKLHNFPRALTKFINQQENMLTDLAERDIFRERAEGSGTYNDLRQSLGEPPVTTFLELTGGDLELANELEALYEGDIDKVDPGIGILVEPKADGFALGFVQFYQFVLNAPRRVKSNRHLSEGFTYKEYAEGIDWVEHSGGMLGVMARHLPGLKPSMEGVTRSFMPWKDVEKFPFRILTSLVADEVKVFKSDLCSCVLAGVILWIFAILDVCSSMVASLLCVAVIGWNMGLMVTRTLAMRFMQQCWKKCYTDKRSYMFGTLTRAEKDIQRAAFFSKLLNVVPVLVALAVSKPYFASHYLLDLILALLVINGIAVWKRAGTFVADSQLLKISLRNRMRQGAPVTDEKLLSGETAIEKAFDVFRSEKERNVATMSSIYKTLHECGLTRWQSFKAAVHLILCLGRKTHQGLSREEKRVSKIGILDFFSIYIPNLVQALDRLGDPIYAQIGNAKRLVPGSVDTEELDLLFRKFAPGRDYMTLYDFDRMSEAHSSDRGCKCSGSWLSSFLNSGRGRLSAKTLMIFADKVQKEGSNLVPAISKEMLLRIYQGTALCDLRKEHTEGDLDPSPITSITVLQSMNTRELNQLYLKSSIGTFPNNDLEGKGFILSSSLLGKLFCWVNIDKLYGLNPYKNVSLRGKSWVDQQDAMINDQKIGSLTALFIHHEFRQVYSDLFLGKAFFRLPFGIRIFALLTAVEMKAR